MQPFNYTINTQGAGEAFTQGAQRTAGLMATAQDYQNAQRIATQQQQKAEADQYKRQRFQEVAQNPSSKDVSRLLIEFPELHEGISKSLDFMSSEEKRNTQQVSYSVLSALEKNKPEVAIGYIDQQLEAARQSKDDAATGRLEMLRDSVVSNPTGAKFGLHGILFSSMGGDKYSNAMKAIGENEREAELQPALVEKGKADAAKEGVDAKYADETARTNINDKRSQIEDRKFDQRIKVMESALKREDNALKREELQIKIDDAKTKREETQRMKGAESDVAMSSIATTKGLLNDILKDEDTLRSATGAGAWRGSIPGTESRAMAGKIEQLQNALAAENLDRLKGAMSDKDIMFIKNISANLDRYQDEDKLVSELKRVQQVLNDAEERTAKKFGVQSPGDKKAEPVAGDALSRLKQKYGVK